MPSIVNPASYCRWLMVFCIVFVCGTLYYNIRRCTTTPIASLKSLLLFSSSTDPPYTTHEQCRLSLVESDDWFCELDQDWLRRKRLHHIQDKRNRISNSRNLFFQNNWEPTIQCAFERRLGNTGDGGKWICDPHRMQIMNSTLLVYSFGSNGDFSFERAIKTELPNAEIHTFDLGIYACPDNICTFHQARLGNGKLDGSKTLQMVMNELSHRQRKIDILKVDIEGSEFDLFQELFQSNSQSTDNKVPYIRQILFEIHIRSRGEDGSLRAHTLFELFRANNYAIFHKEANLFEPQNVFEYALIRLNPAFFIPKSS